MVVVWHVSGMHASSQSSMQLTTSLHADSSALHAVDSQRMRSISMHAADEAGPCHRSACIFSACNCMHATAMHAQGHACSCYACTCSACSRSAWDYSHAMWRYNMGMRRTRRAPRLLQRGSVSKRVACITADFSLVVVQSVSVWKLRW